MDLGVNITMECDKECHFCFLDLDGRQIDLERFIEALDSNHYERVTISGGEPLSRNDLWRFLDEIYKRGAQANVITNGTFLDEFASKRLAEYAGLKLYVSYHYHNSELREKMLFAHRQGVSVNAHIVLEKRTYDDLQRIFYDIHFVDAIMILYPTNTGGTSKVMMFTADEWIAMITASKNLAEAYNFELFYEPAFVRRDMPRVEEVLCPAGKDPFLHVDGKNYPCCLLVDSEYGRDDNFKPTPFDHRKCPILNVDQQVENDTYRRICPLVFTDAEEQKFVLPSRIGELGMHYQSDRLPTTQRASRKVARASMSSES